MKTVTGAWIKGVRLLLDMTQIEFAERLGVAQGTIANWENGKRQPVGPARIILETLELEAKRRTLEKIPA